FSGTVTYLTGPQPKDSSGADYQTGLAGGTSPVQTASFEGVYPLFATTSSITALTKQALYSMLSGNNIELNLTAETGGNKQKFEVPAAWINSRPLTAVQYFNTVSNQYDTSNKFSDFAV